MIQVRRSQSRGHANLGWIDAHYTFSFASYHDPDFMGFSKLRVLNQDLVQPGQGFPKHGHKDMEIITYVLEGVLEHEDGLGNGSQIRPGEVQLMSAGTGITHSEANGSETSYLHLLQMWVLPAEQGTPPRYDQRKFSEAERQDRLRLVVSPDGAQDSLVIGQDVCLHVGTLAPESVIEFHPPEGRTGWLHVARGEVVLNGHFLSQGDGAAIRNEPMLKFEGRKDAELVLFDLP
ncbi:MAG: redox-sensitive bicupin YhaK (pirin superfamily) [Chlamydiales bacterium]|jgi:redox-sensitive bicupin YhaK (pirin superfamily)